MLFGFLNLSGPEEDSYKKAAEDKTSIGSILLELKYVTPEDLEAAIKVQKSRAPLGRILVDDMKVITEDQLEEALLEQKIRRKKASLKEMSRFHSKRNGRMVTEVKNVLHCLALKVRPTE